MLRPISQLEFQSEEGIDEGRRNDDRVDQAAGHRRHSFKDSDSVHLDRVLGRHCRTYHLYDPQPLASVAATAAPSR